MFFFEFHGKTLKTMRIASGGPSTGISRTPAPRASRGARGGSPRRAKSVGPPTLLLELEARKTNPETTCVVWLARAWKYNVAPLALACPRQRSGARVFFTRRAAAKSTRHRGSASAIRLAVANWGARSHESVRPGVPLRGSLSLS